MSILGRLGRVWWRKEAVRGRWKWRMAHVLDFVWEVVFQVVPGVQVHVEFGAFGADLVV